MPKPNTLWFLGAFTILASGGTVRASESLGEALWQDSETTLHLRSHYLRRDRSWQNGSLAWAGGGWVAYRSGQVWNALQLGMTAYTSQNLHGPADKDGTALLLTGQHSYSVLGEAFAALSYREQQLTAGRFLVNQHEVNPQDTRMTPRTFQGISLNGKAAGVDYFIGRLDKMKSRNWDEFREIASVAGAPTGIRTPLNLVSLRVRPQNRLDLGFSSYRLRNLLASHFAEATWLTPVSGDTQLRLGGQYFRQRSTGAHLLTDSPFSTWAAGIKAEVLHGPFTLAAVLMKTGEGAAYRMPFGSWPGYASRIINNFNRAGERVRAIDVSMDCARLGVPGLLLNGSLTVGDHAINASNGTLLSRNRETNLTADYSFSTGQWPQWTKPLSLRLRLARFEESLGSQSKTTDEYHFILKYSISNK